MRVDQQPGFVLHARAWRETSLLLEVLSRDHGRVGLVARGVRGARTRTPRALLQPLVPLSLSWNGQGELATLTAVEAAGGELVFAGEALLCGLYLNELVARMLPRNDAHPEIFAAYATTLGRLERGKAPSWHLRRFERDLLADLGYGMVLEREAETDAPVDPERDYAYRFDTGPVPWRGASDGLKLRGAALLALAADCEPPAEDLAALRRLMRALIAHHLDGAGLRAWSLFSDAQVRGGGGG
jgi:DNA repair protein RecO (recombination protein O)